MNTKQVRKMNKAAPANFNAAKFITQCGGVSAAIRKLTAEGYDRGDVAQLLNKCYQHVRNVLITPISKQKEVVVVGREGEEADVAGL